MCFTLPYVILDMTMTEGSLFWKVVRTLYCFSVSLPHMCTQSFVFQVSMASYPGFNACCNAHDRCYTSCNSGRSSCDNKFKSCLLQQCGWNAYNGVHDEEMTKTCNHLVKIMTFLVRSFGCTAYQNGQKYSCICS